MSVFSPLRSQVGQSLSPGKWHYCIPHSWWQADQQMSINFSKRHRFNPLLTANSQLNYDFITHSWPPCCQVSWSPWLLPSTPSLKRALWFMVIWNPSSQEVKLPGENWLPIPSHLNTCPKSKFIFRTAHSSRIDPSSGKFTTDPPAHWQNHKMRVWGQLWCLPSDLEQIVWTLWPASILSVKWALPF